jgi:MscS family membrane protein
MCAPREWYLIRQLKVRSSWLQQSVQFCLAASLCFGLLTSTLTAWGQLPAAVAGQAAAPQSTTPSTVEDPLNRTTPRGTVVGFLTAAYNQKYDLAAQYMNTHLKESDAVTLAKQLFFVLDRKLPARLNNVSNDPLGSLTDPVDSKRELIGSVVTPDGGVDIYLERIDRPHAASIWLFSRETLTGIPDLYDEINATTVEHYVPSFLLKKIFGISLFALAYFVVFVPLVYVLLSLLNSLGSAALAYILRRLLHRPELPKRNILPHPMRLLIVAATMGATGHKISLSLAARQIGSTIAVLLVIVAFVWAMFRMNERLERFMKRRMERQGRLGATAILRPARRMMDFIAIIVGLMLMLHKMGINASTTLAGLGVGGIAIALAAQKTLENVIGGASLILDGSLRVGDSFKAGNVVGTIEVIGLRSTTVRTPDRTIVTIPNGQIATMTLENFSARDHFWFRQLIGVEHQTPPAALNSLLSEVREILKRESRIVPSTDRVRFVRFAESNLELEVVANIFAQNWDHFLEIQEELLMKIRGQIEATGVEFGYPARALFLKNNSDINAAATQGAPQEMDVTKETGRETQSR